MSLLSDWTSKVDILRLVKSFMSSFSPHEVVCPGFGEEVAEILAQFSSLHLVVGLQVVFRKQERGESQEVSKCLPECHNEVHSPNCHANEVGILAETVNNDHDRNLTTGGR